MGLMVYLTPVAPGRTPFVYDSTSTYVEILIASSFNMVAQNLFTFTNQHACPATVGLIAYSGVFYNFIADVLIFNL